MATKRKDGRWMATRRISGRQICGYGRTEAEAEADLIRKLNAEDSPSPGSVDAFVWRVWWPRVLVRCSTLTRVKYSQIYADYVYPVIGELPIDRVTQADCQRVVSEAAAKGRSPKVCELIQQQVAAILKLATQNGDIHRNPALGLAVPPPRPRRERSLTLTQVRDLLESVERYPTINVSVFLAAILGLRRAEICGLKWSAIDRERLMLTVDRQRTNLKRHGGNVETAPKAGKVRRIPLTPWMLEEIERRGDLDSAMVAGGRTSDVLTKNWVRYRARLGLADWTFHDLRHAAASTLNALGVDLVTIAAILGHSKIDTTLLYANTVEGSARKAADKLADALGRTSG